MILRHILRFIGYQHYLRFGVRDRIIRAFHNPDSCPSENFKVPFFGKFYSGNFSTFIDWSVYYYGAYSFDELDLMRDTIKGVTNPIVIDIGANIGHHSLFAATIAEQVHSFEPFPAVFEKIKEKIKINNISNITIHEIGLGESNEDLPYTPPDSCNTGTGSFTNRSKEISSRLSLPVRKGDDYLKSLNLTKIDFIKMDIEGYEPQALRGLKNTLEKYRPIVFFEWSTNERNIDVKHNDLFPCKYQIFDFITDEIVLCFFKKPGYKLKENKGLNNDGNKVAIPEEKMKEFLIKRTLNI